MKSKDSLALILFAILLIMFGWFLGLKTERLLIEKGFHVLKNGKVVCTTVINDNVNSSEHETLTKDVENPFISKIDSIYEIDSNKRYDEFFKNK